MFALPLSLLAVSALSAPALATDTKTTDTRTTNNTTITIKGEHGELPVVKEEWFCGKEQSKVEGDCRKWQKAQEKQLGKKGRLLTTGSCSAENAYGKSVPYANGRTCMSFLAKGEVSFVLNPK